MSWFVFQTGSHWALLPWFIIGAFIGGIAIEIAERIIDR